MVELARRVEDVYSPETHCCVLIDPEDQLWRPLVDILMPGHDWDKYRLEGLRPACRGINTMATVEVAKELFPALEVDLRNAPASGVLCLVMASGGATAVWL